MDDRTLLELAAKAAGWPVTGLAPLHMCAHGSDLALIIRNDRGGESVWNPLADDGDALRLAVKLRLVIQHAQKYVVVMDQDRNVAEHQDNKENGFDLYAATRRAIVLAAAELGMTK